MERQLYVDYPQKKRLEMLESNCDAVEEMDYTEILETTELAERKDRLAMRSIEESRILDRKKEALDEFKDLLKPIKEEKTQLLQEIKHGSVSRFGKCYKIVEGDRVGYYNPVGFLVMERAAKPEERQLTIAHAQREGTNNK